MSKKVTVLVDLGDSPRTAFSRGFWKGLAAPLLLFSSHHLPSQAEPKSFQPLPNRAAPQQNDWVRVGNALRNAAEKERQRAS